MGDDALEPFYKDGLRFTCRRCSRCCGTTPGVVYLSRSDLDALCAFFSLSAADFVERYCRWETYYGGAPVLALQEKKNYDCILWDGGCSAYPARPVQCVTWPFWTWMLADRAAWEECAADCPGMNSGTLWAAADIVANSHAYRKNEPLRRDAFLAGEERPS